MIVDISYSRVVKLCAIVGHNRGRDTLSANDVLPDEVFRVYLSDFGQRLAFHPLGEVVNDVFVLLWRSRELANDNRAPFGKRSWNDDTAQWGR